MEKISLMITMISEKPGEPLPALLRGLFPACELCAGPGWEVLLPAPGIVLQLFGPGAQPPAYLAASRQPVISYAVDDLQKAIDEALAQGAVILQEATNDSTGFTFCYLQFSGEQPFGFFSTSEK